METLYYNRDWDGIIRALSFTYIDDKEALILWLVETSLQDGNLDFVATLKDIGFAVDRGVGATLERLLVNKGNIDKAAAMVDRGLVDKRLLTQIRDKAYLYPTIRPKEATDGLIARLNWLGDTFVIFRDT